MIDSELLAPLTTITNILSRRPGPVDLAGLRRVSETQGFTTFVETTKEGFVRVSVTGAVFVVDIDLNDQEKVVDVAVSAAGDVIDNCDLVTGFGGNTIASVLLNDLKQSTLREYSKNIRALQVWDALGESYPTKVADLYKEVKSKLSSVVTDIVGNSNGRVGICGNFNNGNSQIRINPHSVEFWPPVWVPTEVSSLINGVEKLICDEKDEKMREVYTKALDFSGVSCEGKRVCIMASSFIPIEMAEYNNIDDIKRIVEILKSWQDIADMLQHAKLIDEHPVVDIDLTNVELSDVFTDNEDVPTETEVLITVGADGNAII